MTTLINIGLKPGEYILKMPPAEVNHNFSLSELYNAALTQAMRLTPIHTRRSELSREVPECFGLLPERKSGELPAGVAEWDLSIWECTREHIALRNELNKEGYTCVEGYDEDGELYQWQNHVWQTDFNKKEITVSQFVTAWSRYHWYQKHHATVVQAAVRKGEQLSRCAACPLWQQCAAIARV